MMHNEAMSFALGFGSVRERDRSRVTTSVDAAPSRGRIVLTAVPSSRRDRCTIALAATDGVAPGVADVNTQLVLAGIRTISLTCTGGVTRVTVPAESEPTAVAALAEFATHWEQRPTLNRWTLLPRGRRRAPRS